MLIRSPETVRSRQTQAAGKPISSRRAMAILDVLVAGIAISTAALLAASAITVVNRSRHRADRLQFAVQELNNQLERASSLKWDELTPEALAKFQKSEMAVARIPEARLELSVSEISQPRQAKKLAAKMDWPDSDQNRQQPLRLTTWVFAQQETP
jgi:hypothetical protein